MRINKIIPELMILIIMTIPAMGQEVTPLILSNAELVSVNSSSASITWTTSIESDTQVQWGENEELGSESIVDESVNCHIAHINDLSPGMMYYYRIGSGGRWSEIGSFQTLDPAESFTGIRFAIISDTHFDSDGINSAGGSMLGDIPEIMVSLVEEINELDLDFTLFLGDSVNGAEEDYSDFSSIVDEIAVQKFYVMGNWEKQYEDWEYLTSEYLDIEETYFSFDTGGYHIIILDSAVQGEVGGSLDQNQLEWLEADLSSNPHTPTIVFLHHTMIVDPIMGLDQTSMDRILSVLDHNGQVISVISGHNHKNTIIDGGNQRDHMTLASVIQYPIGYTIIELYDGGYAKSFHKVESELRISEESRVRMEATSASSDVDEEYLGSVEERNIFADIPDDHPTQIDSVVIEPDRVFPGDEAIIAVSAYDPDHEEIEYTYEVDSGRILGSGPEVTWVAPETSGDHLVRIQLSTDHGEISTEAYLTVINRGDEGSNRAPEVDSLIASSYDVSTGELIDITATGSDPDGNDITFKFTSTGGEIIGSGNSVSWRAPEIPGDFRITVIASDGQLDSDPSEITIRVALADTDDSDHVRSVDGGDPLIMAPFSIMIIGLLLHVIKSIRGNRDHNWRR